MREPADNRWLLAIMAGLAGWVVPGLGHLVLKEKKRALIIFLTISLTFFIGIYIGSVAVVNPAGPWYWYLGQILNTPLVALVGQVTVARHMEVFGRPCELGQIYTLIAGLLNLLCILNVVYVVYVGRNETAGE
jgi:hypothetical protein